MTVTRNTCGVLRTASTSFPREPGRGVLRKFWVACCLLFVFSTCTPAQTAPTFYEWAHRLPRTTRILMTGAHPDDEHSPLLAYLSRGQFVNCAYLSATRGEGGQNLIGPELFDALGIIRTEELLASRRYDHYEQFFTRAYDFGFSKVPEEAFAKWGREEILGDIVRVIRRYRPDIIISVFSGTPQDGHGHHQAIGILTPEAFRAAANPSRFPEQLAQGLHPWQAQRLYVIGRGSHESQSFLIDVGQFSPQLGESFTEVAATGRSEHQSQGQGTERHKGTQAVSLRLVDSAGNAGASGVPPGTPPPPSPLDSNAVRQDFQQILQWGVPAWTNLAGDEKDRLPFLNSELAEIDALAAEIAGHASSERPSTLVSTLSRGIEMLRSLRKKVISSTLSEERQNDLGEHLRWKEQDFTEALVTALGLSLEARADQPSIVPGATVDITTTLLNRSDVRVDPLTIKAEANRDWAVQKVAGDAKPLTYNESVVWKFSASTAPESLPTEMYWLQLQRMGDRYNVANRALIGRAENPPEISFTAAFRVGEDPSSPSFQITRFVEFVHVDPRYGERRQSFKVVPQLSISSLPAQLIIPRSSAVQAKAVFVRIESEGPGRIDGTVKLLLPRGWKSIPIAVAFSAAMRGQVILKKFVLRIPPNAASGDYPVLTVATVGEQNFSRGFQAINYPHIREQNFYRTAQTLAHVLDLKVPPNLKVGYVMGTGDRIPEALREMGIDVTLLDEQALSIGAFSGFDAILTGIRAYDVRRDLVQNNGRLLDYVRSGGTLIVQYNSASFGLKPALKRSDQRNSPETENQTFQRKELLKKLQEIKGPQPAEVMEPFVDAARQFGPFSMLRWALNELPREETSVEKPAREAEQTVNDFDRVVDETAPVKILAPKNPIFVFPNVISDKDFGGWVQERGLYFMRSWDAKYSPLLSSHDPGEADQSGGMLYAKYGKGNYVFTGYSWFRQLPAGVGGAYRIFANLVSLSRGHSKPQLSRNGTTGP